MANETIEELYRRFAPVVHRRARALLGSADEARDATQEVFLVLQQELHTFRGDSAIFTWIYRVATHHCLNRLRARKVRTAAQLKLSLEPGAGSVAESGAAALERRDLIGRLLDDLAPRQVQVLLHVYYDDMSQEEVADVMGISDRAVRKALRKALDQARRRALELDALREAT